MSEYCLNQFIGRGGCGAIASPREPILSSPAGIAARSDARVGSIAALVMPKKEAKTPGYVPGRVGESMSEIIKKYLTKIEVSEMFQVTPRTVESWMRSGLLPYVRIARTVRFRLQDLEECLNRNNRFQAYGE